MNKKKKKTQRSEGCQCLCKDIGPALSGLVHKLAPPEQARRHFEAARIEFLKGLRALVDARIERLSKPRAKGEKITVE
jgi:hypothetical protein